LLENLPAMNSQCNKYTNGGALDIKAFATEHRLKVTRDGEGEDIEHVIVGRIGQSQIYQHSQELLGVLFMSDGRKPPRTGLFNTFRDACIAVGMTPHQIGDAEGTFLFDPMNPEQAKAAIKGIRARVKRQMSPERIATLTMTLSRARLKVSNPCQERSV